MSVRCWMAVFAACSLAAMPATVRAAPKPPAIGPATEQDLQKPVHYQFDKTPLPEAIEYLAGEVRVGFCLDDKAIRIAGPDARVTGRGKRDTLEDALGKLLSPLNLVAMVRDEVLWITTKDVAESCLETKVYKVLVRVDDWDALLKTVREKVAPKTWSTVGGPADLAAWPAGALVVWQTQENHRLLQRQYGRFLSPVQSAEATAGKRARHGRPGPLDFLSQPTACEFAKTPFKEAVESLAAQHKVKIELDQKALDDAGLSTDVACTLRLHGVRLESALNLLVRPLGLVWTPDQGTLRVTTPEEAQHKYLADVKYDVKDLLAAVQGDADALTDVITTTVSPASWNADGGASIMLFTRTSLQVKQTYQVHRALERLLADLRLSR